MRINRVTQDVYDSPIGASAQLADEYAGPGGILDLSQGAPSYPPPDVVVDELARSVRDPAVARYTPRTGVPELRRAVARDLTDRYGGDIAAEHVLVTAGCNQAFCVAVSTVAQAGDAVVVPTPYYFNHDMWLKLQDIRPAYLPVRPGGQPDPDAARALITDRTRAVVLVSPGNPTGGVVDPDVIRRFAELAAEHDIALLLDETYKAFGPRERPHDVFADPQWSRHVVGLHSFSKEFAVPGYRVGAAIASPSLVVQMEKHLDCTAICAPHVGQRAVLHALEHATGWRGERAAEVAARRGEFAALMERRPAGLELVSCGGFFGWIRHHRRLSSADVVRMLVREHGVITLPGSAFGPDEDDFVRASFANLSADDVADLGRRLDTVTF